MPPEQAIYLNNRLARVKHWQDCCISYPLTMSALSTSSCESWLCETPQTIDGFQDLIPRPGQSRGVSFESTCVIIPDCEPGKVRRKM